MYTRPFRLFCLLCGSGMRVVVRDDPKSLQKPAAAALRFDIMLSPPLHPRQFDAIAIDVGDRGAYNAHRPAMHKIVGWEKQNNKAKRRRDDGDAPPRRNEATTRVRQGGQAG